MAYENQIKCIGCGKSIPDVPEGSPAEALLCISCYEEAEKEAENDADEDHREGEGSRQ